MKFSMNIGDFNIDEFVKSFVQDAISKVVQPLSEAWGDEDLEEDEEAAVVSEMVAQLEDD